MILCLNYLVTIYAEIYTLDFSCSMETSFVKPLDKWFINTFTSRGPTNSNYTDYRVNVTTKILSMVQDVSSNMDLIGHV